MTLITFSSAMLISQKFFFLCLAGWEAHGRFGRKSISVVFGRGRGDEDLKRLFEL